MSHWIAGAVKKPGSLTKTAKRTGKSFRELAHSKNPLTRKRAILAQTFRKMARRRKGRHA